jgi:putative two-component system response regulator
MGEPDANRTALLAMPDGCSWPAPLGAPVFAAEVAQLAASMHQDLARQLEEANRKLAEYAREREQYAELDRQKMAQIELANQQLRNYAKDLRQSVDRERHRARDLESAYLETVRRLTEASAFKDRETGGHIQRLSHYARELVLAAGAAPALAERLYMAAPMHDLGKIGIPDAILHKPGPLNEEEWKVMRQHPIIGARLLEGSNSSLLEVGREVAIAHHERWDGTGYPYGLQGEQIPYAARVIAIADTYDALRSIRAYKAALSHQTAVSILLNGDGRTQPSHFDPALLAVFATVHERFDEIFHSIQDETETQP